MGPRAFEGCVLLPPHPASQRNLRRLLFSRRVVRPARSCLSFGTHPRHGGSPYGTRRRPGERGWRPAPRARAGGRTSVFVGLMLYCSRESRSVRADLKGLPHVHPPWRSPAARPVAEVPVHHIARRAPLFRAPCPDWVPVDLARRQPARTARLALGACHDPVELARSPRLYRRTGTHATAACRSCRPTAAFATDDRNRPRGSLLSSSPFSHLPVLRSLAAGQFRPRHAWVCRSNSAAP